MATVILSTGKTFNAEWAAEAFDKLWAAQIIGSDVIEVVTAFANIDSITVKIDGMKDAVYDGYKYIDSAKVMSNGDIQITMRKEA